MFSGKICSTNQPLLVVRAVQKHDNICPGDEYPFDCNFLMSYYRDWMAYNKNENKKAILERLEQMIFDFVSQAHLHLLDMPAFMSVSNESDNCQSYKTLFKRHQNKRLDILSNKLFTAEVYRRWKKQSVCGNLFSQIFLFVGKK